MFSPVGAVLGNVVGAFAGALAVASAGHLYTYLTGQPDILLKIPGLITLPPGSLGFRGLHALLEQDSAAGIGLMTEMAMTGTVSPSGCCWPTASPPCCLRGGNGSHKTSRRRLSLNLRGRYDNTS